MINRKKFLVGLLSLLIILGVAYFFFREFRLNWQAIQAHHLRYRIVDLALAFVFMMATYLVATYGWLLALRSLRPGVRLHFLDAIAIVNTSNLTKYLPGKVWSYALQFIWLSSAGVSKSLVVYLNIVNVLVMLIGAGLVGGAYLLYSSSVIPAWAVAAAFAALLIVDVIFVEFNHVVFNVLIRIFNRISRRNIQYLNFPRRLLLKLHGVSILSSICFGIGAYFSCTGIGLVLTREGAFEVMAAMILSDVIGFVAIIVPGGLGVREAAMFLLLKGVSTGPLATLAIVAPLVTRAINMAVDCSLGVAGSLLFRWRSKSLQAQVDRPR